MSNSTLSRRAILAGAASVSALAVPAAAAAVAAPPASPALAAPAADDRAATVARAEQIVELLRGCFICEGWALDEERAGVFLANVRQLDPQDGDALPPIIEWVSDHGQSLDWIFRREVDGMICGLAASWASCDAHLDSSAVISTGRQM
jgi:hypothetical protein